MLIGLKHCQEGKNNGSVLWLFLLIMVSWPTAKLKVQTYQQEQLKVLLINKHKTMLEMWHILKAILGKWSDNINTQQFLSVCDVTLLNTSN